MRFIFYIIILCGTSSFAQKKIATINMNSEITFATIDRVGELYVGTSNGQIHRFSTEGKPLSVYKNESVPTLFDPRDGARLFAFFRKERKIEYLSPSFEISASFIIDSAFVIEPWLACASGDHNWWILDAADKTLKKINPRASTLEVDIKIPEQLSIDFTKITFIREYQGFVFLLDDSKGIHIFNGMGKWIKTLAAPDLPYFNFFGEELYYPSKNKLLYFNLFTTERREEPINMPYKFALVTDENLFLVQNNTIDFFEFKP